MKLQLPIFYLLLSLLFVGFSACGEDDDTPNNPVIGTIADIVADAPDFTTLATALARTDLIQRLDQPTARYTVFAPTNQAFANAGIDLASLSDEELAEILSYHVIRGTVLRDGDIESGRSEVGSFNTTGPADAALPLTFDNDGGAIRINNMATIGGPRIEAVNGVIYPIDMVLSPPTLVDRATLNGNFTTLLTALTRVGLDSVLAADGGYTVFAPTDAAFTASGINLATVSDDDLRDLLLYHVLGMEIPAADIPGGQSFQTTLSTAGPNGSQLSLLLESGDGVKVNDTATVVTADVNARNGVIHAIDQVLEMQDIVDFVVKADATSELEAALTTAMLVDDLMGPGPFTVFAPVDDAFADASDTLATFNTDTLTDILLYHVIVGSNVRSSMLMDSMVVNTAGAFSGSPFTVRITEDADGNALPPVLITADSTRVNFITTDIQATNGVIHLIDQILLPDLEE